MLDIEDLHGTSWTLLWTPRLLKWHPSLLVVSFQRLQCHTLEIWEIPKSIAFWKEDYIRFLVRDPICLANGCGFNLVVQGIQGAQGAMHNRRWNDLNGGPEEIKVS